jgi:hypothetical protein
MLALAAANAVGAVLFGALYSVAGANLMSQATFLACLVMLLSLVTSLWIRTEARHQCLDPLRRVGKAAAGLMLVVLATPMIVLMPLFWLDTHLPQDAGLQRLLAPIMTVILFSLLLVGLTNLIGSTVVVGRALLQRSRV